MVKICRIKWGSKCHLTDKGSGTHLVKALLFLTEELSPNVCQSHNSTALTQLSAANTGKPEENSEQVNEIVALQFTAN
jgi:hypothetical protein